MYGLVPYLLCGVGPHKLLKGDEGRYMVSYKVLVIEESNSRACLGTHAWVRYIFFNNLYPLKCVVCQSSD